MDEELIPNDRGYDKVDWSSTKIVLIDYPFIDCLSAPEP